MPYTNNHPRRLISAFVVRCLDSTIRLLAIVFVAEQAGLSRTWSKPEDRFSHDVTYFSVISQWEMHRLH